MQHLRSDERESAFKRIEKGQAFRVSFFLAMACLQQTLSFTKGKWRPLALSQQQQQVSVALSFTVAKLRPLTLSQHRPLSLSARQKHGVVIRDGSPSFFTPYSNIRQQIRNAFDFDAPDEERKLDVEELALALTQSPCWFTIFDEVMPSMEELVSVEQVLASGHSLNTIALAELLLLQGRFDEAEAKLNKVIQDDAALDQVVTAQVKLGMLLENLGRLDEAEFHLKQAAVVNSHEGALEFLDLFLADHRRSPSSLQTSRRQELWNPTPAAFLKDLPNAWFGHLRLGLVHKSKGKERLANQNLLIAHRHHTTQALLGLHLERAGEVRGAWYKLLSLHGKPITYPKPKPWTDEDDKLLLSRVEFDDPKSILTRRSICKTPLWEL